MRAALAAFTVSVETALTHQNWVGALGTALTLPDICGWLESPSSSSRTRYVTWFDRFVGQRYVKKMGATDTEHVFLSGDDCYALRCALLHEGSDNISRQHAKKALSAFRLVAPRHGWNVHMNQANDTLQLQVDIFCRDICAGVDEWSKSVLSGSADVQARTRELLTVETLDGGFTL